MNKQLRREIGIKRFKREGLNYGQIGEEIKQFKEDTTGIKKNPLVDAKQYEEPAQGNRVQDILSQKFKEIHWWQKVWMRSKIWIEKVILKIGIKLRKD